MAITPIVDVEIPAGVTGGTSDPVDTTGANLLVINMAWFQTDNPPTDSFDNEWVKGPSEFDISALMGATIYYALNPVVGADHTFTSVNQFGAGAVQSFSGVGGVGPSTGSFGNTGTSAQPGSLTPAVDGCLLVAGIGENTQPTDDSVVVDSDFTLTDQQFYVGGVNFGAAMAYLIQTSAAAVNPTFSWTGSASSVQAVMIEFLPSPFVQSKASTTGSAEFDEGNTEGNFLVCVFRLTSATLPVGFTDTNDNDWAIVATVTNASSKFGIAFAPDCAAGANTVQASAASFTQMVIAEYNSVALASVLDQNTNGISPDSETDWVSGEITPTVVRSLIIAMVENETVNSLTLSDIGEFTNRNNAAGNIFLLDLVVESESAVQAAGTLSSAVHWGSAIANFKLAGADPTTFSISGNCGWPNAQVFYQRPF